MSCVHSQLLFLPCVPHLDNHLVVTGGHIVQPVAVELVGMEGSARRAHGVEGEAVGTLDEVGAVHGVSVQPIVPFLAKCIHI